MDQSFSKSFGKLGQWFLLATALNLAACRQADWPLEPEEDEQLSGGQVTVFDDSPNAFGHAAPGLEGLQELEFFVGNSFFNQSWVTAPASTTARDGIGPLFNARSCSGCHFKDGRGRPPEFDGESSTGFLLRLGQGGIDPSGVAPVPSYGHQLQDQALPGVPVEGQVMIQYVEFPGQYPDGQAYSLRSPTYYIAMPGYALMPADLMISPRVANQMPGLGLLEAIPEAALLAYADEWDGNADGISGRPNQVWDTESQGTRMGRFGWKANQPSLKQQTAGAFLGDMGITTSLFPDENCTSVQADCQAAPNGGLPEIEDDDLRKVVLYVRTLAVPARRKWDDQSVLRGKAQFEEIGCTACHVPKFVTGAFPDVPALAHQTIRPYTDLLLHDMGDGLADGRPDFLATGYEWRTPPLWGIGLFPTVNQHSLYLHDGRARNLEEAILWHGGESQASMARFVQLSRSDREAIIAFLNSL